MAGEAQDAVWPLPKFRFVVDWDDQTNLSFAEVSGMESNVQPIEYRHSNSPEFSMIKMPGQRADGSVTFRKGVFKSDNKFWEWYSAIKMNTIKRVPITIKLLDEEGNPTMVWKLLNAWPTKVTGTDLNSSSNEVAIESIEVAHEGVVIESS